MDLKPHNQIPHKVGSQGTLSAPRACAPWRDRGTSLLGGSAIIRRELTEHLQKCGIAIREAAEIVIAVQDECCPSRALEAAKRACPNSIVLFIATCGSEELAIAALRRGASDYIRWPADADRLISWWRRANLAGVQADVEPALIGQSAIMQAVRRSVERLAGKPCNVLISGETGTGKDIVARLLHLWSPRATHPFEPINCAAVPEGLFESELFGYERGAFTGATAKSDGRLRAASGGTVFLDEIGELPLNLQPKLLRAIEQREVQRLGSRRSEMIDVRWTTASNRDLEAEADAGRFRRDLLYRLNVCTIAIPALRDRREDIAELAQSFLVELATLYTPEIPRFTPDALDCLIAYRWPGNVRELRNVIEGSLVRSTGAEIRVDDLPLAIGGAAVVVSYPTEALERHRILEALRATRGNKSEAANRLRWSRMTLYRKMARHRLAVSGSETL